MKWITLKPMSMHFLINKFRFIFLPFSFLYWGITISRNFFYSIGFFISKRLTVPTISVGNITIGGTGKTPIVIAIAQLLLKMDRHPGIISRGYGRRSTGCVPVSDGRRLLVPWEEAGDEPFMIAKKLPSVPVVVDEEKYRGANYAIEKFNVDIILLDDAFQHRSVERDLDIVLFNSCDPKEYYRMLPYGRLREPIRSVRRADFIIWSRADQKSPSNSIKKALDVTKYKQIKTGLKVESTTNLKGKKVFAFCGIGDPNSFYKILQEQGAKILELKIFPDHHNYSVGEINNLKMKAEQLKADYIVTSEKDWVKISHWKEDLNLITPIPIKLNWFNNSEQVIIERIKSLLH
ncbi:MAG: tetraacyldisaccharide 4'-kinase [Candidatus Marinimicrobia bacterium]|nr:tetraacyldisaccharide 4'-kinase [Candidatus Neomarinimicrobiota bacterium]